MSKVVLVRCHAGAKLDHVGLVGGNQFLHLLTFTKEASDSSSAGISALTSLSDNLRHREELANMVLSYL